MMPKKREAESNLASIMQNTVLLGHEAYRDGYKPGDVLPDGTVVTGDMNIGEGINAVVGHTMLADRLGKVFGYDNYNDQYINANIMGDLMAFYGGGMNALISRAITAYDHSEDYWKLSVNEDGELELAWDNSYDITYINAEGKEVKVKYEDIIKDKAMNSGLLDFLSGNNITVTDDMLKEFKLVQDLGIKIMALKNIIVKASNDDFDDAAKKYLNTANSLAKSSFIFASLINQPNSVIDNKRNLALPVSGPKPKITTGMGREICTFYAGDWVPGSIRNHAGYDMLGNYFLAPTDGKIALHWNRISGFISGIICEVDGEKYGFYHGHNAANALDLITQTIMFNGGTEIAQGNIIGMSGPASTIKYDYDAITGWASGKHSHFWIRNNDKYNSVGNVYMFPEFYNENSFNWAPHIKIPSGSEGSKLSGLP